MEITGRVTADAIVNTLKDERTVVNFSIAVNDYFKTKSGEQKTVTEYIRCAYWLGKGVASLLTKGTVVQLFGRISARAFVGNDGEPKAALNFHTSEIKIFDGSKTTNPDNKTATVTAADTEGQQGTDDLPF